MAEQKGCHGNDNENGATATYPKMMPRQHNGGPTTRGDIGAKENCGDYARDGGVIPVTGFPRDDGMTTRRNME